MSRSRDSVYKILINLTKICAFADLMQSWGLTQTDISENIKHTAAKNSLSHPVVRWNDMLAQQGTSTAQKKQIKVAQQLLELLK